MEPSEALARASDEFDRRLAGVTIEQWSIPTPCADWTVRDLTDHLIGGNRFAAHLLTGASLDEAIAAAFAGGFGDDPVGEFRAAAVAQRQAFAVPGALERVVHHHIGDMPGAQLLGFRLGDLTLHAWDLARATGGDERLDHELLVQVWKEFEPRAAFIAQSGRFGNGPSGEVPDDAPLQERLLDLTGRRP